MLNYMSSVWVALIIGAGVAMVDEIAGVDRKMVAAILVSFVGVLCLLQSNVGGGSSQFVGGMARPISGVFTALVCVKVHQLDGLGENEACIALYFFLASVIADGV